MMRRLVLRSLLLRRVVAVRTPFLCRPLTKFTTPPKLLLLTSYGIFPKESTRESMENFDLKLKEACERGEAGIIELMDFLKTKVTQTGKAYKDCLQKQIDIIDEATKVGPTSTKWDDLPEYRSLATELNQDFNSFAVAVNAIGELAKNEALQFITQHKKLFHIINKKHKELSKIINKQMDDFKKLENKLLAKTRDHIQKT